MRRKKQQDRENQAIGFGSAPAQAARLTPAEIQQKEFRLAFRGYNEKDVDEFLDRVTEQLAAYVEENERLRQGAGSVGVPAAGGSSEAEGILARAREQAAAIVREAEAKAKAAALGSLGGPRSGDERAAVGPYLLREREFLQSLGQLVQDHARTVRAMVERSKGGQTAVVSAKPEVGPVVIEPGVPVATEHETAVAPQQGQTAPPSAPGSSVPEGETSEPDKRQSLRELFWGED
jgi:DivIVA domain-containing protein